MTPQQQMKELLAKVDIPAKTIECYGSQIVVTAWSDEAARKWAAVLNRFAEVRGIVKTIEKTKDPSGYFAANPGLVKSTFVHDVWRVFARV